MLFKINIEIKIAKINCDIIHNHDGAEIVNMAKIKWENIIETEVKEIVIK